jgi:hypothetical protein
VLFNLERFDGVHLLDLFVDENLYLHAKNRKKIKFGVQIFNAYDILVRQNCITLEVKIYQ